MPAPINNLQLATSYCLSLVKQAQWEEAHEIKTFLIGLKNLRHFNSLHPSASGLHLYNGITGSSRSLCNNLMFSHVLLEFMASNLLRSFSFDHNARPLPTTSDYNVAY